MKINTYQQIEVEFNRNMKISHLEESDNSNLRILDERLCSLNSVECLSGRSSLLLQPRDNSVGCTTTRIFDGLTIPIEINKLIGMIYLTR